MKPPRRNPEEVTVLMNRLELLFKQIGTFQEMNLLEVTPEPRPSTKNLKPQTDDVAKWYQTSIRWTKGHNYNPRFIYNHFLRFFGSKQSLLE
jgi:hypothetical protein